MNMETVAMERRQICKYVQHLRANSIINNALFCLFISLGMSLIKYKYLEIAYWAQLVLDSAMLSFDMMIN